MTEGGRRGPMPRSYFEDLYRHDDDPWAFATSWYESRKYALTLAALPERRYARAFEPGCSIGVLTAGLAGRCDRVLAADHMDHAVRAAGARTAGLGGVTVERRTIPEDWPTGPFDLLVLSEVCYYFDGPELRSLLDLAVTSLAPGATIVAVHWRGATNYPLGGDRTHEILAATEGFEAVASHREEAFVLDVWRGPHGDQDAAGGAIPQPFPSSGSALGAGKVPGPTRPRSRSAGQDVVDSGKVERGLVEGHPGYGVGPDPVEDERRIPPPQRGLNASGRVDYPGQQHLHHGEIGRGDPRS